MSDQQLSSEESQELRNEVRRQKAEAEHREEVELAKDRLKNRVSVAAIIMTTALSFIGNVKANRSGNVEGGRAQAESARRQGAELWAYYQTAASERTELQMSVDRIRLELARRGPATDDPVTKIEQLRLAQYEERIREFHSDTDTVFHRIQDLEAQEDELARRTLEPQRAAARYELGSKIITLALILLSVTILSNRTWLFWGGVMLGALGMLTAFDGYLLFF
jgi:hypothetical protein